MEMHQVRYFLAVARVLNFTRAAEECNVAQPSLTRAIKQLEAEFGEELFRRERNLTHLTEFGRRMTPLLQQCYDSAIAAKSVAASFKKGAVAPLSLAISTGVNLSLVVSHLTELTRTFEGLELQFMRGGPEEIAEHLKKGDAEVAVAGPLDQSWDRLDSWPLFTEDVHIAVNNAHRFASREAIDPTDLANERLIIRTYCELAENFTNFLTTRQVTPSVCHKIVSEQDYLVLLEANMGVGLMPESALRSSQTKSLRIDGLDLSRTVYLHAVAGRQRSAAANALMKLLKASDWLGIKSQYSLQPDNDAASAELPEIEGVGTYDATKDVEKQA